LTLPLGQLCFTRLFAVGIKLWLKQPFTLVQMYSFAINGARACLIATRIKIASESVLFCANVRRVVAQPLAQLT
jgi:hypothetical protein